MEFSNPGRKRRREYENGVAQASPSLASDATTSQSRRASSGLVSQRDLDDLRPQLIYGALLSIAKSTGQSLCLIAPVVRWWRIISAVLLLYVLLFWFFPWATLAAHTGTLLAYAFVETCFFFRMRKLHQRLNRIRPMADRPLPPKGARDLSNRVMDVVRSSESWHASQGVGRNSQQWLQMWFLGTPVEDIPRGNLVEFSAWAFFTKQPKELDEANLTLVDHWIGELERLFEWTFKPGYDPKVRAIRINFDPLRVWYHPLCYYVGVWSLLKGARQYVRFLGGTYHPRASPTNSTGLSYFHIGPPAKPGILIDGGSHVSHPKESPIVFVHGLGPGLSPYLRFLRRLAPEYECFVIELPDVSQAGEVEALAAKDMADALAAILEAHGHSQACFIAHSFGTFVLAWTLKWRQEIVAKAMFLDPVCFLLAQPDVAFNVLYRQPRNWFTMFAANTVFWELYTANSLHRNFIWYNNVLWLDELPAQAFVALSSMDDIANANAVRCYLQDHQRNTRGTHGQLKLLWFDGFFHGEIFLNKSAQLQIMEFI